MTGPFLLSISVLFLVSSLLFFGSVRQIKLAIRQLLGARKYSASYRIVSDEVKMPSLQNYKVLGNINHRLSAIQGRRRKIYSELEMWANAQRDGRPAKCRWRPLFNAAKFG